METRGNETNVQGSAKEACSVTLGKRKTLSRCLTIPEASKKSSADGKGSKGKSKPKQAERRGKRGKGKSNKTKIKKEKEEKRGKKEKRKQPDQTGRLGFLLHGDSLVVAAAGGRHGPVNIVLGGDLDVGEVRLPQELRHADERGPVEQRHVAEGGDVGEGPDEAVSHVGGHEAVLELEPQLLLLLLPGGGPVHRRGVAEEDDQVRGRRHELVDEHLFGDDAVVGHGRREHAVQERVPLPEQQPVDDDAQQARLQHHLVADRLAPGKRPSDHASECKANAKGQLREKSPPTHTTHNMQRSLQF